ASASAPFFTSRIAGFCAKSGRTSAILTFALLPAPTALTRTSADAAATAAIAATYPKRPTRFRRFRPAVISSPSSVYDYRGTPGRDALPPPPPRQRPASVICDL